MDTMIRGLAADGAIRALAIDLTDTVSEAQRRQYSFPTATAALGRLLIAAAAMSSTLKDRQRLTLQVMGDGPLGSVIAEANWKGELRGFVKRPQEYIPPRPDNKLDVGTGVGKNGMLYVIKDLGLKEPYRGSVSLLSGEIAEDVASYFAHSEQIPTVFAAGVLVDTDSTVKAAGGYLIQLMPGATDELIDSLESKMGKAPSASMMLADGLSPQEMLTTVLEGFSVEFVGETQQLEYHCDCNRERLSRVLTSLGVEELDEMIAEGKAEVICHFCGEKYLFDKEELEELRRRAEVKKP